jgi:hypothetical protein
MRREKLAEGILGSVMSPSRASAIVGDLSEVNAPKSAARFWLCVAGIVLSSSWTWIVALAAGIYLAAWSVVFLNGVLLGQALQAVLGWDPPRSHFYTSLWIKSPDGLAQLSTLLLLLVPYVVIRYGLKDKLTRVLLGSLVLIFGTTCLWRLPAALATCVATGMVGIVACLWTSERRRALGITASVAAAGFLSAPVADWLISLVHHPAFGCELQGCIAQTAPLDASQMFLAVPMVLLCTLMHKQLIRRDEADGFEPIQQ